MNYQKSNYKKGKLFNKERLLVDLGLNTDVSRPLISFISRLSSQKGVNLVIDTIYDLLSYSTACFVIIGSGDNDSEIALSRLADEFRDRVYYWKGFNDDLARKTYAASDIFLMPSHFEPSGLSQMIASHYGTICVVRKTGGLLDSIPPYNKEDLTNSVGFTFKNISYYEFKDSIYQAINVFLYNKEHWNILISNAMKKNFSITKTASEYIKLYEKIMKDY
jgi:starch synthase